MKRIITLLIIATFSTCLFAQHFGLRIGGSITDMAMETDTISYNTKIKPGFVRGIVLEFPLKNTMAINTSLNFKSVGTWIHQDLGITGWRVNYIDLDITYEYIFHLGELEVFAQGGGYLAYALYGKEVYKPENGPETSEKLNIGTSDEDVITPLDAGLIIGAGVYFGKIRLSASYQPGLANISNVEDWRIRNQVGTLTFTYLFNRPKE